MLSSLTTLSLPRPPPAEESTAATMSRTEVTERPVCSVRCEDPLLCLVGFSQQPRESSSDVTPSLQTRKRSTEHGAACLGHTRVPAEATMDPRPSLTPPWTLSPRFTLLLQKKAEAVSNCSVNQ